MLLFVLHALYEEEIPKELQKYHKVWVANPGAGLEKQQCSVQLAFSPEDDNLRIAVIFRGTGKRISEDEINSYHESVNVCWQHNAWADTTVCVNWLKKNSCPSYERQARFYFVL